MTSKRIGVVTGGGDCPGLNTVIRAVAKAAAQRGWETLGFFGGYEGLLEPRKFVNLDYNATSGLLLRGGMILGTANRGQFSAKTGHGESRGLPTELPNETKEGFEAMGLSGVISIGGDGSLSIAAWQGPQVSAIKISDAIGRLKIVRPDGTVIRTAQALGISLGD